MERQRRLLPLLAALAGLTWMAAVLFIAANPKGIDLAADLAYDRANRVHTLALVLLLATVVAMHRVVGTSDLAGRRAAGALVIGAVLMLLGNAVSFWGALFTDGTSEQFWGGWVGWLTFLPGLLLLLVGPMALAAAARDWPETSRLQRWSIGSFGLLLALTTGTWAISPAVTLAPALLATFALLVTGTAVADATGASAAAFTPTEGPRRTIEPAG
jgi:hypothetical protein